MRSLTHTPFAAICQTEVLLNTKRIVPYVMCVLFAANAVLWWGWGAATRYGWATNSDFYIVRNLTGFSFMTLPLFTALLMGDAVLRDFRFGVAPLILSKPVGRAAYLLGKFFGNFFVLVCCQSAFMLTLIVLQAFHPAQMAVLAPRLAPYLEYFLVLIVISHLTLAAIYFTVGTLTRSLKIVYGLAVCFYPLYITEQVLMRNAPQRWRIVLDPLLANWGGAAMKNIAGGWFNAAAINQLAYSYDANVIANRVAMLCITALCLTVLYVRFAKAERFTSDAERSGTATLNLTPTNERFERITNAPPANAAQSVVANAAEKVTLPVVAVSTVSFKTNLIKLLAAVSVEFRLLRAERSLVVLLPLVVFISTLELAFYKTAPAPSYTAAYASSTAQALLLFLFGLTVFYTGEAMHRDREVRVESLLWSAPTPNYVLLLSKFLANVLLNLALIASVALVAIGLQLYKGDDPVELSGYLLVYSVILLPSVVVIAAAVVLLNVLLRDKYLTYAVSIAIGVGLFYLYGQGYRHWLYNPVLYQLWTYSDLTSASSKQTRIFTHRLYWLASACACLACAHVLFQRKATRGLLIDGRLSSTAVSLLLAVAAGTVALGAGYALVSLLTLR
jgi:ABC-2 type transport system permease protein